MSALPASHPTAVAVDTGAPAIDGPSALALFAALQAQAQAQGVPLRPPPPEPTTCCGRGCNGCVWEGFLSAAEYWRQDALQALNG
ncbi:oxidoreductase-like domain-containing protein [Acidovorax sp. 106]|uniref:oxidoreductase-like domain-containing protein n=1 Tax=Acidovorax sp. 106 TaxID=2135637 RepID=UPI000EB53173|nr:oxidoreductase-like domain-containing protein [Acidovorax sp. 106]RLJ39703.1 oxidoreductase family protein [Acidovorax sp. 106]